MAVTEIPLGKLNPQDFIDAQVRNIKESVGGALAVNALSGGVDSSVVTMLGHKALGDRLKTFFIENGIMREGEPEYIAGVFAKLGVKVEILDAKKKFFSALKGLVDPEEKREAITRTFYKTVFGPLVKKSKALAAAGVREA